MRLQRLLVASGFAVAACSSTPPPADWQLNAKGALERAVEAWLSGDARVEAAEFARAYAETARTGRADLLARVELTRCAARVASLAFDACPGFARLAADAGDAERAYAAYLAGQLAPQQAALLPAPQRAVAAGSASAEALGAIADPLSRLVAAGVLLRAARAEPAVIALAIDTASARGWRRPLAAWLQVQLQRARAAGDADAVSRLERRIALVTEPAARAASAP